MATTTTIIDLCPACPTPSFFRFCGNDTVESELCFITPINADDFDKVEVTIDTAHLKIELMCCNMFVVCGFFTKKIFKNTATPDAPVYVEVTSQDVPFQLNILADIPVIDLNKWTISNASVCNGCYALACKETLADRTVVYHKLKEKDIIAVEIKSV